MNRFFSKFPWLRPLGCGLLVCALVLSICLPLLGMRAAEPDNPILQAEPQEITVLQAGNAPGHSGSGDDNFNTPLLCVFGKRLHFCRCAVSGEGIDFERYAKIV